MGAYGMARRRKHEDHVNHEAWAIPYADLMTLLLAFFVVMYAISSVNEGKYRVVADSLTAAFGGAPRTINPVQVGNTQVQGSNFDRPTPIKTGIRNGSSAPALVTDPTLLASRLRMGSPLQVGDPQRVQQAQQQLGGIAGRLVDALSSLVAKQLVNVRQGDLWLEVEINSDILFPAGSATLDTGARDVLSKLAMVLADTPNPVRVEGYTDNQPIHTLQFPSNWELSATRAASVVHLFAANGITPDRLAVVGYGEFRARADNTTVEGRNRNRRVVLIILAAPDGAPVPVTGLAPTATAAAGTASNVSRGVN
jgi:chemotaxis protein MotB